MNTPGTPSHDRLAPIAPGTPCYITASGGSHAFMIGRVVVVQRGPRERFGDGPGPFYEVRADWLAQRFPTMRVFITERRFLRPITPGEGASVSDQIRDLADLLVQDRAAKDASGVSVGDQIRTLASQLRRPA